MTDRRAGFNGSIAAALLVVLVAGASGARADLDSYVARPEPAARAETTSRSRDGDLERLDVSLLSQTWRGIDWRHVVEIFRPPRVAVAGVAVLYVAGTGERWAVASARQLAAAAGVVTAVVDGVPNQPLFDGRVEDDLVAFTFERYVEGGDDEWPLLFPMTKAAVKALDAVRDAVRTEWGVGVERFVVTGASKRGWTSWLAAVADRRVAGIVPIVFDNLNFGPQMKNQLATWGRYSEMLGDYSSRGLPALVDTERGRKLASLVDPFAARDRLATTRKLVVNGTNDPYWTLDALHLYWDELAGDRHVLYVPNAGHGAATDGRVVAATAELVRRLGAGASLPAIDAARVDDGGRVGLRVTTSEPAAEVRLWSATSATRDFRRARWSSVETKDDGGASVGAVERPARGYVALIAETTFSEGERRWSQSTPVSIVAPEGSVPGTDASR